MKILRNTAIVLLLMLALFAGSSTVRTYAQVLGNTITAGTATITLAASKVFTVNNTLTLAGTDSTTQTFPTTSATIARTDAAQTFTGIQTIPGIINSAAQAQSSASLGGSPVTLTALQCGQSFNLDVATGVIYILPATFPAAGCTYDFYVTTSVTSNAHEIETGSGSHFFSGAPFMIAAAATLATGQCNGTSHIAYKTNGSTTGGLIGTHIKVMILSATVALLDGVNAGSGSLATACSASN